MNVNDILKYKGQLVLLELSNGYKFTTIIPSFTGTSFDIIDKFGKNVTIDCELVRMVYEK